MRDRGRKVVFMKLKKVYAAVTAAVCSFGMIGFTPLVNTGISAKEAVRNDFEETYEGWHGSNTDVVLTAESGIGYNGSRGMLISGRTCPGDGAVSSKGFYLSGGIKYRYSFKVFSERERDFTVTLTFADEKTDKENTVTLIQQNVKGGEWTELSAEFTAPENTYEYRIAVTNDSADDFVLDDVLITTDENENTVSAAAAGLKNVFGNYFRVGNILNGSTVNKSAITANIIKDCNSVECENETKPDHTLVQNGSSNNNVKVSLEKCSAIMDFCVKNKIGMRAHTLVWHSQTPEWFFKEGFQNWGGWVNKSVMNQRLESYIKNMFGAIKAQYPTLDLYAYDVCNECMSDD